MRKRFRWLICAAFVVPACAQVNFTFDANSTRWELSNGVVEAGFQLGADGHFSLRRLTHVHSGNTWTPAPGEVSSPVSLTLGEFSYNAATPLRLVDQSTEDLPQGRRQSIVLEDLRATARIRIDLELYNNQPVLRHRVSITNLTSDTVYATSADLVPYTLATSGQPLQMFHVRQWNLDPDLSFAPKQQPITADASTLSTGAVGDDCAWLAIRTEGNQGLFAGWEFDGRANASARLMGDGASLQLSAQIADLHHPIEAGATFTLPAAFLGMFEGDWDQAGFRTQQFSEGVLARPAPPNFPYVSWDSWGYSTMVNEESLLTNAGIASTLGFDLFLVDLGWARQIGDWREDPAKFPSGLRALSDNIHRLGMKFGLHFALAEVAPDTPVLAEHPDWTSTESGEYFGALSLCLSNKPTRDWLVAEAIRMIDDYNVDYILQDGANMVKLCNRTTHTHDPQDSNYSNSVDGINWVIAEIQRQRPNVVWENCENGGHMMTFNMVQLYNTSITNDASGARDSRAGVWGATYPFSPRYADRYMPETPTNTYITRSYMFGGPWHFMNYLADMPGEAKILAQSEIQAYKSIRGTIRDGQVFHLTEAPGEGRFDALESYYAKRDVAVAVVTRDGGEADYIVLRLQGLYPDQTYMVHFQDDPRVLTFSGRQLNVIGVNVHLPQMQSAEIVYVDPLN